MKKAVEGFTPEMARIHAHITGDGTSYSKVRKRSPGSLKAHPRKNAYERVWVAEYTNTCPELLSEFASDVHAAFGRKVTFQAEYHRARIDSCKHILQTLHLIGKNSHNWRLPPEITRGSPEIVSHWLRAFFDDEATIMSQGIIRVKCVNRKGLEQIQLLLNRFHISTTITGPNADATFYLAIPRRFTTIYKEKINFAHPKKRTKLEVL